MFVQIIQGNIDPDNAAELRASIDTWAEEISPGAIGWLGTTGGVTSDGRLIALVRFESAEAAQANSSRPEQDAWWAQASKLFLDEPTFRETTDVTVTQSGDPDQAGFVQIMQGQGSDPVRAREILAANPQAWAAFRPEILGQLGLGFDGGYWAMAIYFTSEAAAHEGEKQDPPANLKAEMDELNSLMIGMPEFFDLTDPWLHSPN